MTLRVVLRSKKNRRSHSEMIAKKGLDVSQIIFSIVWRTKATERGITKELRIFWILFGMCAHELWLVQRTWKSIYFLDTVWEFLFGVLQSSHVFAWLRLRQQSIDDVISMLKKCENFCEHSAKSWKKCSNDVACTQCSQNALKIEILWDFSPGKIYNTPNEVFHMSIFVWVLQSSHVFVWLRLRHQSIDDVISMLKKVREFLRTPRKKLKKVR